jgi:hypothetical protein
MTILPRSTRPALQNFKKLSAASSAIIKFCAVGSTMHIAVGSTMHIAIGSTSLVAVGSTLVFAIGSIASVQYSNFNHTTNRYYQYKHFLKISNALILLQAKATPKDLKEIEVINVVHFDNDISVKRKGKAFEIQSFANLLPNSKPPASPTVSTTTPNETRSTNAQGSSSPGI